MMQKRRGGADLQWVMYAIPGGVVVILVLATLVILAIRPKHDDAEVASATSSRDFASISRPQSEPPPTVEPVAPAPPAPMPTATPAAPATPQAAAPSNASTLVPDSNKQLASAVPAPSPVPSVVPAPPKPPSNAPPSSAPAGSSRDLLASLNMNTDVVSGTWQIVNGVLKCTDGNSKNRARVRLQPPPSGEYDFAITFTAEGKKPYVAQICSFKGRQFSWTYFWNDSGLATVAGKNAHQNPSTVPKGIKAGVKYTSVIKVRNHSISAYLNDELYSSYPTDYNELTMWNGWDIGGSPSSDGNKPLGVAAECPVELTAITVAPGHGEPQGVPTVATSTPPAEPAAPTVSPAFVAYKDLAPVISNPYSPESSAAAPKSVATTQPAAVVLDRVIATSQPVVSEVATDLRRAVDASRQPAAAAAKSAAATPQMAAMYLAVQTSLAPPPIADPLMEFEPASDPVPLLGAPALVSDLSAPLPDRVQFDLEQDRLAAWKKLIGQASQLYPKAKKQQSAIKLVLAPPAGGKAASFLATNSTNKELSDVTLAIELIDATTSPSPTAAEYYFIPNWPAGQKLHFPATCVPNVLSDQLLAATTTSPSLPDLRGITEVRAAAWSDQVIQPAQTTKVEASADSIARMQLDEAYRLIGDSMRRAPTRPAPPANATPAALAATARNNAIVMGPVIPPKMVLADTAPAVVQARAIAQKVVDLNPPQAGLVDQAKALLADPDGALHDLRKKQLDDFVNAIPERKQRPGVWTIHKPGALAKVSSHGGRESLAKGGGAAGRLMLIIEQRSKEGMDVGATLFAPDQPNVRKKFNGRLHVDASSNRVLLQLRAGGTTNKPPTEADLKQVNLWTRLLLEVKDNDLRGIAEVGPIDNPTIVNVGFDPPQEIKLPEEKKK